MMNSKPVDTSSPEVSAGYDTQFLRKQSMKVIIMETATRRVWAGNGLWTTELDHALTFKSGSSAMEYLSHNKCGKVQLVLTRAVTFSEVIPVTSPHLASW